jgi:anti-sigma regulatory factor (Ser/Thr protein kinase)
MKVTASQGELRISVADRGDGVRPRTGSAGLGLGLGLPIIAAVSDQVQFDTGSGGTTVTMPFRYP